MIAYQQSAWETVGNATDPAEVDAELRGWLKQAYTSAGE